MPVPVHASVAVSVATPIVCLLQASPQQKYILLLHIPEDHGSRVLIHGGLVWESRISGLAVCSWQFAVYGHERDDSSREGGNGTQWVCLFCRLGGYSACYLGSRRRDTNRYLVGFSDMGTQGLVMTGQPIEQVYFYFWGFGLLGWSRGVD